MRSPQAPSPPCSLFLLHLLRRTVGGNWSSISAHSCRRGCRGYRRAGSSWVSRQPHCPRGPGGRRARPGRGRGGVTGESAQPLEAGQETVVPFFSKASCRYSCVEVCVHTGPCSVWERFQGRSPSHGEGAAHGAKAGTLTAQHCPTVRPPPRPQAARALGFRKVAILGICVDISSAWDRLTGGAS